jgi:protein TonB
MSFAPKSGLPSEPARRSDMDSNDKPSNLYTGVFGTSNRADDDSPFAQVKTIDTLATSVREMCAAADFDFFATMRFIATGLLEFYNASGVAIAVEDTAGVVCCASAGETAPEVGTPLNIGAGISGVCYRTGQSQYCHDARRDERVDYASCQALGILSILISPVLMGDKTVGLVEVFSPEEFFFDRTDIVALESIAALVAKAHVRRLTSPTPPQAVPVVTEAPKAFAAAAAAAPAPVVVPAAPTKTEAVAAIVAPVLAAAPAPAPVKNITAVPKTSAPSSSGITERSAALTELLATNAAAQPAKSAAKPKSFLNTQNSVLLAAAVLLLVAGGWYGTRTFLRAPAALPAPVAVQPTPVVTQPATVPADAVTAAPKPTDKKPVVATAAKSDSKPPAATPQVVDLLAAPTPTNAPAARNVDATLEAPSLGAVKSNLSLATIASSSTIAPKLSRSSVSEPEVLIHKVAPVYPVIARSAHVNGEVLVRLTIGVDGNVKSAIVEKGPPMLRGAVLDAVKQWRYKPYKLDGKPEEVETLVTVKFQ